MSAPSKSVAILGSLDVGRADLCEAMAKLSAAKYGGNKTDFSPMTQNSVEVKGPKHNYTLHHKESGTGPHKRYDLAVVLISATKGAKSSDEQALLAARDAGCERFVAFMTKCDMLDGDAASLDRAEESVRDILDSSLRHRAKVEIIRGNTGFEFDYDSVKTQDSLVKLFEELERITIRTRN